MLLLLHSCCIAFFALKGCLNQLHSNANNKPKKSYVQRVENIGKRSQSVHELKFNREKMYPSGSKFLCELFFVCLILLLKRLILPLLHILYPCKEKSMLLK